MPFTSQPINQQTLKTNRAIARPGLSAGPPLQCSPIALPFCRRKMGPESAFTSPAQSNKSSTEEHLSACCPPQGGCGRSSVALGCRASQGPKLASARATAHSQSTFKSGFTAHPQGLFPEALPTAAPRPMAASETLIDVARHWRHGARVRRGVGDELGLLFTHQQPLVTQAVLGFFRLHARGCWDGQ